MKSLELDRTSLFHDGVLTTCSAETVLAESICFCIAPVKIFCSSGFNRTGFDTVWSLAETTLLFCSLVRSHAFDEISLRDYPLIIESRCDTSALDGVLDITQNSYVFASSGISTSAASGT